MTWFFLALASAIFSAASTIFEKKSLFSLDALNFSYLVSIVTLVFSIPFFVLMPGIDNAAEGLIILFFKTILNALAFLCVMYSMKNLELSEALPLLAISPGIVAFVAFILLGDVLTLNEWVGILLIISGTYLLELKKERSNLFGPFAALIKSTKYKYVLFALLLFTGSSLIDRYLLKGNKLPPYAFMAYQQLFFAIIFITIFLFKKKSLAVPFSSLGKNLFLLILVVSIFTVVYRYTQIAAIKLAPVALVLAVKRLSVLMAIIVGGRLFKENNLRRRIIATVIILSGITFLVS